MKKSGFTSILKDLLGLALLCLTLSFSACKRQANTLHTCSLPDIAIIGIQCDSLRSVSEHSQAAQLYFETGVQNQSSELFVYSAWQFGEANHIDSALIAIKHAVKFGMNSPYILDKVGIDEASKNNPIRKEIDQLLAEIQSRNKSLDNFEIVRTPINRFWNYFDQAMNDSLHAKHYLSNFICEGSSALKDYYHIRYENVDNMYEVMIRRNPEYYQYLRNHITVDKLNKVATESEEMMANFSKLYTKAVFPKTYLVPDLINGSGTLTEQGLYIGVDMFAKSNSMPLKNLNDWQKSTISEFENMKFDLVHELMHFQQSYSDVQNRDLLLGKLIEEGVCDFLVSLLTKDRQVSPSVKLRLDYINDPKNYDFLMSELKRDLYGNDLSKWMHNGGGIQDRPANLGYTIGFLICQSYYDNSKDKEQAIYNLLNTNNFKQIIEESEFRDIL